MAMIEAVGLARTFTTKRGPVEAVRGVDFTVGPGEIVGFLGPNGAGKTTTLRMLTTLLTPTTGSATVAGYDLRTAPGRVRERIGYVAQSGGTDPTLPVAEELLTQGEFYLLTAATTRERARDLCERLDLTGLDERTIGSLSGGQRRRLDIALGLMHAPGLLFLDEPSTGLDPHSRSGLWEHIRAMRAEYGTTVFVSTHYLDEADALCDRVLIIDDGRIVAEDTPTALKRRLSGDVIVVELADPAAREAARTALDEQPGLRAIDDGDTGLRVTVDDGDRALRDVVLALHTGGVHPSAIRLTRPTLDDVFRSVTGRSLPEPTGAHA